MSKGPVVLLSTRVGHSLAALLPLIEVLGRVDVLLPTGVDMILLVVPNETVGPQIRRVIGVHPLHLIGVGDALRYFTMLHFMALDRVL